MSIGISQAVRIDASRPVYRVDTRDHQPMKSGIGPTPHARYQTMLHWVDVHVIHVRPVIGFVFDQMFPEATLPDGVLATALRAREQALHT